jgi:hypothetical protein
MLTDHIKALKTAKAQVAALETEITAERNASLAALPGQYGFADVASFVAAVQAAGGKRRGRKPGIGTGGQRRWNAR